MKNEIARARFTIYLVTQRPVSRFPRFFPFFSIRISFQSRIYGSETPTTTTTRIQRIQRIP